MNTFRFFTIILITIFITSCADEITFDDLAETTIQKEADSNLLKEKRGPTLEIPCDKDCSVSYWDIAEQLNCVPYSPVTCNNVISQFTVGYGNGWLWDGSSTEIFNCRDQIDLKELAKNIALSQAPVCNVGTLEIGYDYFIDFCPCGVSGNTIYSIGVNITYKCCLQNGNTLVNF